MTQHSNQKSKSPKGKPSGNMRGGDGLKEITQDEETSKAIENKYLDTDGNIDDHVNVRHENRNVDKGRRDQGKDEKSD